MEENSNLLSERELEIMRLVATGATNRQIAYELNISINTVKVHLRNVFDKLSVQSRTEATMALVRAGLVKAGDGRPVSEAGPGQEGATADSGQTGQRAWNLGVALAGSVVMLIIVGAVLWTRLGADQAQPVAQPTVTPPPRWQAGLDIPSPQTGLGAVAYQGRIYALAGYTATSSTEPGSRREVTGRSMVMNPETGQWSALPDKPTAVGDVQAAVLEGRIFVPGGEVADGTITSTVEAFDPDTESWTHTPDLPAPRSRYALASLEGKLLLFGGWDGKWFQSSVLVYDAGAGQWSELTALPAPRADMAVAVIEDTVYLIGGTAGQQPLSTTNAYHVYAEGNGDGPWETVEPLPEPRAGAAAAAIARSIYLIGGGENLPPVRYDLARRAWDTIDSPDAGPWYGMGVTTVGNKLYVIGGRTTRPLSGTWEYTALYLYFLPQGASGR